MDLELVEEPCGEGALHDDARPVDQHVLVAGGVLGIVGLAASRSLT